MNKILDFLKESGSSREKNLWDGSVTHAKSSKKISYERNGGWK